MDLPVEDQGVTLTLAAAATDNASVLRFDLTLASRSRDVEREVEHRATNVLPFLFAFYADGRPVIRTLVELDKEGGANWDAELVKEGGSRTWSLRVDAASLSEVLPRGTREAVIVAAFSERQHEPWMPDERLLTMSLSWRIDGAPPVLVRSNAVKLSLGGGGPAGPPAAGRAGLRR